MNHEDYIEMLPLYGLGALEEAEERTLKEHLITCATCRVEVDQWVGTTSALAYAASPLEPSPELRSRLLQSVRSLKAQPGSAASQDSNVVYMPVRATFQQKSLAIAASLALIALLASLFVVWSRNQSLQAEVARLSRGLDEAQGKLARLEQDSEILNAPGLAMASLKGTEVAKQAEGKLMFDQKTGQALFTAANLPPAPAGKAYQLWYITGNKVTPGGVFSIDAEGRGTLRDQLPPEARAATIFAVTLEPAGGVDAPTGEKYLLTPAS